MCYYIDEIWFLKNVQDFVAQFNLFLVLYSLSYFQPIPSKCSLIDFFPNSLEKNALDVYRFYYNFWGGVINNLNEENIPYTSWPTYLYF